MNQIKIHSDLDFYDVFSSEEACVKYLEKKRWNGKPKCPSCGNNDNNYFLKTRKIYKCRKCRKQFSLTKGTIFESTKLPLRKWFYAMYIFLSDKRGIPSTLLAKKLNIQQRTAWLMLHKIRETMKDENQEGILSGIIEVDETWIGSNPNKDLRLRGRMNKHSQESEKGSKQYEHLKTVMGMIDRYNSKIVLRKIGWWRNCLSNEMANHVLKKHVSPISTIITDGNRGYSKVHEHFHSHGVIVKDKILIRKRKDGSEYSRRSNSYVNDKTHVNGIENVWKHVRRIVSSYIQFSYKHTDRYLDEFSFKWNNRDKNNTELFEMVIDNCFGKTLPYKKLIPWNHSVQSKPWMS